MSKQKSDESAFGVAAGSVIPFREREHWGVGCTGLGEDFFLVALCENCGKPAVRLTEDGINLCRECYALCPEDTQNNPVRHEGAQPRSCL